MREAITCGEATIDLLHRYDVDTVFGIPGVHTLDFCRGLAGSGIRHVQARNEQGAGFMADGYARVSGRPGVCLVISGPGVTNALTAIGQAYADSIPVLMLSSDAASYTLGKGWGCLHEVPRLTDVTAPLTAFSATAMRPEDVPELVGQAFSVFASSRPRPVHIAIPLDVLSMPVTEQWQRRNVPQRPHASPSLIDAAARMLTAAELELALPIIIWSNGGLKQIQDDMHARDIALVGVEGMNPDFIALARACGCRAEHCADAESLNSALAAAFEADRPTLIEIRDTDPWLNE